MQSTVGACAAGAAERTVGAILGLDWLPSDGPTSGPGKITAGPPLGPSTTFDGEGGSPFAGRPGLLDILGCGETDGVAALTSLVSHLISPNRRAPALLPTPGQGLTPSQPPTAAAHHGDARSARQPQRPPGLKADCGDGNDGQSQACADEEEWPRH